MLTICYEGVEMSESLAKYDGAGGAPPSPALTFLDQILEAENKRGRSSGSVSSTILSVKDLLRSGGGEDPKVTLPEYVYLKNPEYFLSTNDSHGILFAVPDQQPWTIMKVTAGQGNWINLTTWVNNNFVHYNMEGGDQVMIGAGTGNPTTGTGIWVTPAGTGENQFYLRSWHGGWIEKNRARMIVVPGAANWQRGVFVLNHFTNFSIITITPAVVRRELYDFVYNIRDARTEGRPPLASARQFIYNSSTVASSSQTYTWSYQKSTIGTWTNTYGYQVTVAAKFEAGIPFIGKTEISVSGSHSGSFSTGGSSTETETKSAAHTLSLPPIAPGAPTSSAWCYFEVTQTKLDVDFTYKERLVYSNGTTTTYNRNGMYHNIESGDIKTITSPMPV